MNNIEAIKQEMNEISDFMCADENSGSSFSMSLAEERYEYLENRLEKLQAIRKRK